MPFDKSTVDFLLEKGMYFFCITRETRKQYNHKTWRDETVVTEQVDVVVAHKNVTIWGHDMFRSDKDKELVAYCPLEFPDNIRIHI